VFATPSPKGHVGSFDATSNLLEKP
jgi:hypothetical protein